MNRKYLQAEGSCRHLYYLERNLAIEKSKEKAPHIRIELAPYLDKKCKQTLASTLDTFLLQDTTSPFSVKKKTI